MRSTVAAVLGCGLLAGCHGAAGSRAFVTIESGADVPRPLYLLMTWTAPGGHATSYRLPEAGNLPASGHPLALAIVTLDGAGARRVLVEGRVGSARVGVASASFTPSGGDEDVVLTLRPDSAPPPDAGARPDVGPDTGGVPEDPTLAAGLVAAWRLDDAPGAMIARDSSGNGNDATLMDVAPASGWVAGRVGGAIDLGATGWLRAMNSPTIDSPHDGMTMAAWVQKTPGLPIDTQGCVISREVQTTGREYYALFWRANGTVAMDIDSQAGGPLCATAAPVPAGEWHHLAATVTATATHLYVDGVEACSAAGRQIPSDTTPVLLGANQNGAAIPPTRRFGGKLDEVLLYARALSPAEVARLAAGVRPPSR